MKKLITILTVLAVLLVMTACGEKSASSQAASSEAVSEAVSEPEETTEPEGEAEAQPMIGMPNPVEVRESLDAVNEAVGCKLVHLGVMGITDTDYSTIQSGDYVLGQYCFEFLGGEWTFRAAATAEDISGIYVEGGLISDCLTEDAAYYEADGYYYCRWFVEEMQYSLACKHNDAVTGEQFLSAVNEMKNIQAME